MIACLPCRPRLPTLATAQATYPNTVTSGLKGCTPRAGHRAKRRLLPNSAPKQTGSVKIHYPASGLGSSMLSRLEHCHRSIDSEMADYSTQSHPDDPLFRHLSVLAALWSKPPAASAMYSKPKTRATSCLV